MALTKIGTAAIDDDAITAAKIAADAVGTSEIAADAVGTSEIAADAVGTSEIATDAVDTAEIAADAIGASELANDSVASANIVDDAVTADKLANSINTDIAANTAKVTNATHTGDVTGATALTIATDAVDIAMLSATGTADATTFLRGDNSWAAASYTNPNTVSGCLATLSANQSIAGSSYVKIALDTEVWDLDNEFASNKFTVKTAGRYFIIVQTHMADMGSDKKLQNFIYKNGSDVCNARSNTSSAGHLTAMTANVLELAVDDYIESYVYNGDGTARNASNSVGTYMMIQRIT